MCTYILLTEQFEIISLWRDTQPLLVQKLQLVDGVNVRSTALNHLVGVHRQFLHPAGKDAVLVRTDLFNLHALSEHV